MSLDGTYDFMKCVDVFQLEGVTFAFAVPDKDVTINGVR